MRINRKLAAAPAVLMACSAMLFASSGSASAATHTFRLCNSGSGFDFTVIYPQSGGISTVLINPGRCINYTENAGTPYITRVYNASNTAQYRDTAGYSVWDCNEQVTLSGNYSNTNMTQQCI